MFGALQLLLKNICYHTIQTKQNMIYLLSNQPYTIFFLYLILEFLIYISSITFYYYAYYRFKLTCQSLYYDRFTNYCPSLIAIIILLLFTACKMPLIHDIFLLYAQIHLPFLFITFIFEIIHILLIFVIWIFLTTKLTWKINSNNSLKNNLKIQNIPMENETRLTLPNIDQYDLLKENTYEKVRLPQSDFYYRNRPKNWSLPLNQSSTMIAEFDHNNDIIRRSPSYSLIQKINNNNRTNKLQYRNAIKPNFDEQTQAVFLRSKTPPMKRLTKEQVDIARLRAQKLIHPQNISNQIPQRHSTALLISQV